MKKLLIVVIVGALAWSLYESKFKATENRETAHLENTQETFVNASESSVQFKCDGRQHCSQMTSRAEAEFFVQNCPDTKMDGDRDGIPCENDSRW